MRFKWPIFLMLATFSLGAVETTYRELQFENEKVTVWKMVIAPHMPLQMQNSNCAQILIPQTAGELKRIYQDGSVTSFFLETGKPIWFEGDSLHQLHTDLNESQETLSLTLIEVR